MNRSVLRPTPICPKCHAQLRGQMLGGGVRLVLECPNGDTKIDFDREFNGLIQLQDAARLEVVRQIRQNANVMRFH